MKRILLGLVLLNCVAFAVMPENNRFPVPQVLAVLNPMQAAVNAHQVIPFNAQAAQWERNICVGISTLAGLAGLYFLGKAATVDKRYLGITSYCLFTSGVGLNVLYRN